MSRLAKPALLIFMGAVLYAIASNVGAGWLYVVSAGTLAVVLVSAVAPLWSARGVELTRRPPATGSAGQPLRCEMEVRNTGRLARHLLEIEDRFAGGEGCTVAARVRRGDRVEVEYVVESPRRGVYQGGTAVVESGAPFGLFYGRRRLEVPSTTVVHPATFEIDALPQPAARYESAAGEDPAALRKGEGEDLWGVRDYRPGDQKRLVAWRRSARTLANGDGRLAVVETARQTLPPLTLALDLAPRPPTEAREAVISAGASLMLRAIREGRSVAADAGPQREPFPPDAAAEGVLRWCAGLEAAAPPDARRADIEVLPSLRRPAPAPRTVVVLVSCAGLSGKGPWMSPEEEREWVREMESKGRRVILLGAGPGEPWSLA